jgi:hypothetical protein
MTKTKRAERQIKVPVRCKVKRKCNQYPLLCPYCTKNEARVKKRSYFESGSLWEEGKAFLVWWQDKLKKLKVS